LLDDLSMCSINRTSCLASHHVDLYKHRFYRLSKTVYTLFLEESVSLFAIAGLALLLLLI
ncbi:MAG: hypothetical protein AAFW75_32435, partial [Cyanobacteria bacterium J06636_16]